MFKTIRNNKIGKTLMKPFISAFFCFILQNNKPRIKQDIDKITNEASKTLL